MKKQEIIVKQLRIENYAEQTIRNYLSALKLFLEYVVNLNVEKVTDNETQNYLYYCKTGRKYSYSSMKQVIAAVGYLYTKAFKKDFPESLKI